MIVKVDSSNENKYNLLFEKANEKLLDTTIDSIDAYFANIENLIDKDPNFTILPVDEDIFDIDANTRKINIPSLFAAGASVVGDEVAEIIYFSIDRYFDIQDLANTRIFIQCQTPSKKNYLFDAINITTNLFEVAGEEKYKGKLIFGWPLTSEVTSESGNVSFAVRFYNRKRDFFPTDENNSELDELVYSFSTLTHTIRINPSLNFNILSDNAQQINKNYMIFNRIRNSNLIDAEPCATPQFVLLDSNGEDSDNNTGAHIVKVGNQLWTRVNYKGSEGEESEPEYKWRFNKNGIISTLFEESKYVQFENSSRQAGECYYRQENNQYIYDTNTENGSLYKKYSGVICQGAGTYSVEAINSLGRGQTAHSQLQTYTIPMPASYSITLNFNEENSPAILIANITRNNDGNYSEEDSEITYIWKKQEISENLDNEYIILEGSNESIEIDTSVSANYQLEVIHTIGLDSTSSISEIFTYIIPEEEEIQNEEEELISPNSNINDLDSLNDDINNMGDFDDYEDS